MQVAARLCSNLFEVFSRVKGEGLCLAQEFSLQMKDFMSRISTTPGQYLSNGLCYAPFSLCESVRVECHAIP